jgi:hypothetical protein
MEIYTRFAVEIYVLQAVTLKYNFGTIKSFEFYCQISTIIVLILLKNFVTVSIFFLVCLMHTIQ